MFPFKLRYMACQVFAFTQAPLNPDPQLQALQGMNLQLPLPGKEKVHRAPVWQ